MSLHDLIYSMIRTAVPIGVGALISWGVLPETWGAGAIALSTALISNAYYLLVRVLEERWPKVGILLGVPRAPTYV